MDPTDAEPEAASTVDVPHAPKEEPQPEPGPEKEPAAEAEAAPTTQSSTRTKRKMPAYLAKDYAPEPVNFSGSIIYIVQYKLVRLASPPQCGASRSACRRVRLAASCCRRGPLCSVSTWNGQ